MAPALEAAAIEALAQRSPALDAYQRMAPFYDGFTAANNYERWLACIEGLALAHGIEGRRVLDVGCGTGKSFMPLLERGWEITACDLSPAMVQIARQRLPAGSAARVLVADMRDLPDLGEFDLVTCMDDAIDYLLEPDDLIAAFRNVARLLAPTGVYAFDTNSLGAYQAGMSREFAREDTEAFYVWRGLGPSDFPPEGLASARIEVFARTGHHEWTRSSSQHVQRHHSIATVETALEQAGLRCTQVLGQTRGVCLHAHPDEQLHAKLLFVAQHQP